LIQRYAFKCHVNSHAELEALQSDTAALRQSLTSAQQQSAATAAAAAADESSALRTALAAEQEARHRWEHGWRELSNKLAAVTAAAAAADGDSDHSNSDTDASAAGEDRGSSSDVVDVRAALRQFELALDSALDAQHARSEVMKHITRTTTSSC
jgi:peptidoglycan hydrolase CwlO-like protein